MSVFRHPRTVRERRAGEALNANWGEGSIRVHGRVRALPNELHDIPKGSSRSWKAYRRNQWR